MKLAEFVFEIDGVSGRLAYRVWSRDGLADATRPCVVCAHGVSQNSRHLLPLAEALADDFDVLVPDYPGRGLSAPLSDPMAYNHRFYVRMVAAWLAHLSRPQVDWVGTSMGGLTGLLLAGLAQSPIRHLVLNDVGPVVPLQTLQLAERAYHYAETRFASVEDSLTQMAAYFAQFGLKDPDLRLAFAEAGLRQEADGRWCFDYDRSIFQPTMARLAAGLGEVKFWEDWAAVTCPVLVLHGVLSQTLTAKTVAGMRQGRPQLRVIEVPETAHAPHLYDAEQIGWVRDWLKKP